MTMSEMALSELQILEKLKALNGWERRRKEIFKVFTFKDFDRTMAFVNAIAWVSQRENHHPDLEVGYNRCVVRYSTHSAGGLTDNDFLCAAKIEKLMGL
ncbi:MAG: 4a-hydroxytetrahydrobiopterin dehydratase [Phycisphaerales bacterium]|nr:4a-hydroxytetrahydrobiopterin dehydratase [Phycisphaerales bacterium]